MVKSASVENYRILMSTVMRAQEVSLEDVCAMVEVGMEQLETMASNLYKAMVHHMKGEAFMVVQGVGDASGIESWRNTHNKYSPRRRR